MIPFNGLEQVLMAVINNTIHSDDQNRTSNLQTLIQTPEKRFNNVMLALFGRDYYEPIKKSPSGFSREEMFWIYKQTQNGSTLAKAIQDVIQQRTPTDETTILVEIDEVTMTTYTEQIKKHFQRHKKHYESPFFSFSNKDIEDSIYLDEKTKQELISQRENIFKALRDAGWSVD